MIKAALNLLGSDNSESSKVLLRAFSGDSAIDWPKDGLDLAEIRPDVGQNSSEVVECGFGGHGQHSGQLVDSWRELDPEPCVADKFLLRSGINFLFTSNLADMYDIRARNVKV